MFKWIGYILGMTAVLFLLFVGYVIYLFKDLDRSNEPDPEEFYWNALIDMQHVASSVDALAPKVFAKQSIKKLKEYRKEGMSEPGAMRDFDITLSVAYGRLLGDSREDCYRFISEEELVGSYWGRALLWGSDVGKIVKFRDKINYKNQDRENAEEMREFFGEEKFEVLSKKACLYHALFLRGPRGRTLWNQQEVSPERDEAENTLVTKMLEEEENSKFQVILREETFRAIEVPEEVVHLESKPMRDGRFRQLAGKFWHDNSKNMMKIPVGWFGDNEYYDEIMSLKGYIDEDDIYQHQEKVKEMMDDNLDKIEAARTFLGETSLSELFVMEDKVVSSGQKADGKYGVWENSELIYEAPMKDTVYLPVRDIIFKGDEMGFSFTKLKDESCKELVEGGFGTCENVYWAGETLNEKYGFDYSERPFLYQGKLGFVAREIGKGIRIYWDGTAVSPEFDGIRLQSCCSMQPSPFKIYDNGVLFMMVEKGGRYFLWEIDLEEVKREQK